jgi:hypothetical protein
MSYSSRPTTPCFSSCARRFSLTIASSRRYFARAKVAARSASLSFTSRSPLRTRLPSVKWIPTILPSVSACNSTPSSASNVPVDVTLSLSRVGFTSYVVTATAALGERPDLGWVEALFSSAPDEACSSGTSFGAASAPSTASEIAVSNVYRITGFTGQSAPRDSPPLFGWRPLFKTQGQRLTLRCAASRHGDPGRVQSVTLIVNCQRRSGIAWASTLPSVSPVRARK